MGYISQVIFAISQNEKDKEKASQYSFVKRFISKPFTKEIAQDVVKENFDLIRLLVNYSLAINLQTVKACYFPLMSPSET